MIENYILYQQPVSKCKVRKFLRGRMLITVKNRLKNNCKKTANLFADLKTIDKEICF